MKEVTIGNLELYDEEKNEFVYLEATTLQLEHSLISLKKWEEKWKVPFLSKKDKTEEQLRDYIRCMTITPKNVNPKVYKYMPLPIVNEIQEYINDSMTATWFSDNKTIGGQTNSNQVITAEIIYYWMITFNVPVEFQKWHLNQLLTLIRVLSIKNTPKGKMTAKERQSAAAQRRALNEARLAKLHTTG